jgi:hypothetical protein
MDRTSNLQHASPQFQIPAEPNRFPIKVIQTTPKQPIDRRISVAPMMDWTDGL